MSFTISVVILSRWGQVREHNPDYSLFFKLPTNRFYIIKNSRDSVTYVPLIANALEKLSFKK